MIEKWILSAKMKSCHQDLFFRLSPGEIRHNVGIHSHPSLIKYEFSIAQIYNILNMICRVDEISISVKVGVVVSTFLYQVNNPH